MLESKDLELIAQVVTDVNKPIIERLDRLESKVDNLESRMDNLESRMDGLESKVTDIQMTLENETNKNIQIIAEGHLDLSRKLDDALKVEHEKEMLLLQVNRLENDVRRIKDRIEGIV